MKKGDLVKLLDENGETGELALFMESFIPADRDISVYDLLDNAADGNYKQPTTVDSKTLHFKVFVDGNVRFLNAVYWTLLPTYDD